MASIHQERLNNPNMPMEENLIRHFIVNSVRSNYAKFKSNYGNMVICADSRSWRKDYFELYKITRSLNKDKTKDDPDSLDWEIVYKVINETFEMLDKFSPFKCIKAPGAEADDIIGWACNKYGKTFSDDNDIYAGFGSSSESEEILIISGDKDFQQLQVYKNVTQYSPTLKKYLKCQNPKEFLIEHIAKGDVGDSVPNILSSDRTFIDKIRQKPITTKFLDEFKSKFENPIEVNSKIQKDEFLKNFSRNKTLINLLECIPQNIQYNIEIEYNKENEGSLELLRQAFISYRMKNMLDVLADFKAFK
jgi:hypothetical protein